MRTKGMRDIPTMYGLAKRSKPNSRDEAITEMARLEHEKVRLERELSLWQKNEQRTQGRLKQVQDRLALLQGMVENHPASGQPPEGSPGADEPAGNEGERWTVIQMEY
ncbi:MAG: hypothetical protein M1546_09640 [Chloroflexi bacterium]|nr:hypothetical protein [Chloroflexota bacterium]